MGDSKAILIVGGPSRGTRFRPLSLDVPKVLLPLTRLMVASLSRRGPSHYLPPFDSATKSPFDQGGLVNWLLRGICVSRFRQERVGTIPQLVYQVYMSFGV